MQHLCFDILLPIWRMIFAENCKTNLTMCRSLYCDKIFWVSSKWPWGIFVWYLIQFYAYLQLKNKNVSQEAQNNLADSSKLSVVCMTLINMATPFANMAASVKQKNGYWFAKKLTISDIHTTYSKYSQVTTVLAVLHRVLRGGHAAENHGSGGSLTCHFKVTAS